MELHNRKWSYSETGYGLGIFRKGCLFEKETKVVMKERESEIFIGWILSWRNNFIIDAILKTVR